MVWPVSGVSLVLSETPRWLDGAKGKLVRSKTYRPVSQRVDRCLGKRGTLAHSRLAEARGQLSPVFRPANFLLISPPSL